MPDASGPAANGKKATALVMAASRLGAADSVAALQNKSHKCLVEIDGVVMLERVVATLIDSNHFSRIYISIEGEDVIRPVPRLAEWLDEGRIAVVGSVGNLADSVAKAAAEIPDPYPLVITTGDNALHTAALIDDFMTKFNAGDADVAAAFTSADVVRREFPEVGLAYHVLKDGEYSACNLYAFRRERALGAVEVFRGGGQFGKRHWRIFKAFGLRPFVLYKLRLVGLEKLMQTIGRKLGVSVDTIDLPYAFGPIDVDNPQFFAISERALRERRRETRRGEAIHEN